MSHDGFTDLDLAGQGPLSSSQLSSTVSDNSRLRVAYQGVPGAYSESVARKAYPNCESAARKAFEYSDTHQLEHYYYGDMALEDTEGNMAFDDMVVFEEIALADIEDCLKDALHQHGLSSPLN
ncbi:hypothetical protein RIF29_10436 [Crotalaria pallida]|uniref:Prephenate dehydratase domain-containing protein n=1 Tax=Crotalaria pallida TaxID=3830 RepID=A0AAN9IKS9_CROPI